MSKPFTSVITTTDGDTYVDVRIPVLKLRDLKKRDQDMTVSDVMEARRIAVAAADELINEYISALERALRVTIETRINADTDFTYGN